MADPDVGNIQLATVNNPRRPPCEEKKALYIAVVQEKVLRTLTSAEMLPLADVIQRPSTEPTRRDHEVVPHVHAAAITISNAAN